MVGQATRLYYVGMRIQKAQLSSRQRLREAVEVIDLEITGGGLHLLG